MHILTIGSLSGDLGAFAQLARAQGARLLHADDHQDVSSLLLEVSTIDRVIVLLPHDIAKLRNLFADHGLKLPILACSRDVAAEVGAIADGAQDFMATPFKAEQIAAWMREPATTHHALIAQDPTMLALIRRAEQVAVSDATVLITGASGTGKENLARHIHGCSRRSKGPFVALNCAAVPDTLLESELFGHERGAFSGAIARRIGKFEAAEGGTLLLDEVTEMDVRLQAKLLRVIQERELDRLGGTTAVPVNLRILATSNRDIPAEVAAGRFRADLYFRLNVVGLSIPSLQDRHADVSFLAAHFARFYAAANGVPHRPFSFAALRRLLQHPWPGNVRELENTVHRAVLLGSGLELGVEALELTQARHDGRATPAGIASLVGQTMQNVERDLILHTLTHTSGNRTHAAQMLGISIRALRNKLRDYADASTGTVLHAV